MAERGDTRAAVARGQAWLGTPAGRRAAAWARRLFTVAMVAFLVWNLVRQGITPASLWASLPRTPWFYVIWLAFYALLPTTETVIYRRLWGAPLAELLPVLLRKRVLSQDVLGYSGEVYLYGWARTRLGAPPPEGTGPPALLHIKDNVLISSFASVLSAAVIIGGVLLVGAHGLDDAFSNPTPIYVVLAAVAAVFVLTMATRARRAVFTLSPRGLAFLSVAHGLRFTLSNLLLLLLWTTTVPGLPMRVWLTLLVVNVVVDRVPFVPASDLVFLNTALALASPLGVDPARISGVLVGKAALEKAVNLVLFAAAPLLLRSARRVEQSPELGDVAVGDDGPREAPADGLGGASPQSVEGRTVRVERREGTGEGGSIA